MATVELLMPKMGESIIEATILSWLKQEGDTIAIDEPICEVATDKVDSEVPSEFEGTITKILHNEGDAVAIGAPLAIIEIEGEAPADSSSLSTTTVENTVVETATQIEEEIEQVSTATVSQASVTYSDRFYSPLVLNIAKAENIAMEELNQVPGTGKDNRVTKHDIKAYLKNRNTESNLPTAKATPSKTETQAVAKPIIKANTATTATSGNVEVVEMDRMRKLIAKHMLNSVQTSAHVSSFVEADVTKIVNWRNKVKNKFLKQEGEKITFMPIFIEAIAKAIRDFPNINASIEGDNLILKKDINIGMAAALPDGNLIVPVIKNADQLNLVGLAKQVNDLGSRAKKGQLKPNEIEGGTYTVSNIGSFGNILGTPIINQPQIGILAVGSIQKKPVVIETEAGDVIGIRSMMYLSHSYDHRVVDGALGGMFVKRVADYLENFDDTRDI